MKYFKTLFLTFLSLSFLGLIAVISLYFYVKPELPSAAVLKDVRLQTPMKIYSEDGLLINQYGVKRRIPLELKNIPKQLKEAVLATEDYRFYEHPGVDPIGVMRAFINLVATGEKGQGASTITMQLARNFFFTREKAWMRKIKETFLALHIESLLTKDEILELYLNKIELGHRAFGVGAAAQVYFGKDINELSLAQLATIAGLPKAPSTLNPISNPQRSLERRRVVLGRMLSVKYITQAEYDQAANEDIQAAKHGAEIELSAPYLADMIYAEMVQRYGKEEAETGGYQVFATVSSQVQRAAQFAVMQNLHDYDERHGYRGPIQQLWEEPQTSEDKNTDTLADVTEMPSVSAAWPQEDILEFLSDKTGFGPLKPAVVTQVYEQQIQILDKSGQSISIDWDGLAWARPFINDQKQGKAPEKASDILSPGAFIWIRYNSQLEAWQLAQFPDASGALVSLDYQTGAVAAVVGGYSFKQSQFNRATQAKRQVGSNIKPFVYSAALENGFTLASILNDAPITQVYRSSGAAWRPKNSPEIYDGPIRMRYAFGRSKNVVSIRLLQAVGLDNVIDHLSRFGFEREELPRDDTLALGSASMTPMEVVRGMAVFANGGYLIEPYFIQRIENEFGDNLWQANPAVVPSQQHNLQLVSADTDDTLDTDLTSEQIFAPRVLSEQNAFLTREMMRTAVYGGGNWSRDTGWNGTGFRATYFIKRRDLAGKTGTTNDAKDTWFSGIGGNLVTTSWVGFDDMSRSLGRTSRNQYLINKNPVAFNRMGNAMVGGEDGARVAQPAWIRFMQEALSEQQEEYRPVPDNILTVRIDRNTGKLTQSTDHSSRFEFFQKGTEPTEFVDNIEFIDPFAGEDKSQQEEEIF